MKRLVVSVLITLILIPVVAAGYPGEWNVYLDASSVNRITSIGDSLWCATNGGILLFDLSDSTMTRYFEGLGFRSSDVTAVTIGSGGSIWAGFRGAGIVRIDDPGGDPSVKSYTALFDFLVSDSVTCLAPAAGDIYYGSRNGVAKFFDNLHSLEVQLSENLEGKVVYDLLYDGPNDRLWVASGEGIYSFDRATFTLTLFPIGEVRSICEYNGAFYCTCGNGIQIFDGSSWTPFGSNLHMAPVAVSSGGGELFCASPERVYQWNGSYWASVNTSEMKDLFLGVYKIGWGENTLKTLAVDRSGTPWIGGRVDGENRGTYISGFAAGSWQNRKLDVLTQNSVIEMSSDGYGGIWISTRYYGVDYMSAGGEWTAYTKTRDDTGDDNALTRSSFNFAVLFDSNGFLWCNSANFDLDMLEVNDPFDKGDDIWRHFSLDDGTTISSDRFFKAKEDPAGNRWFMADDIEQSTHGYGVSIANAGASSWLSINPITKPEMTGGSVFDCVFQGNSVYLAIRGYGVQRWFAGGFDWASLVDDSDDYWITLIDQQDLTNTVISCIALGDDNTLWVGTAGGLVRYSSGITTTLNTGDGLIGNSITDLEIDSYGSVWVATDKGINKLDPDGNVLETFTTALLWQEEFQFTYPSSVISPLPSHHCNALEYDPESDFLWIGTENGAARLDVTPVAEEVIPLSTMILYPNPVHISRGDETLRISRISGTVDVRVYNIEGELVHEASNVSDGEDIWDILTINGYRARSGIYLVRITNGKSTEIRKVAVIR